MFMIVCMRESLCYLLEENGVIRVSSHSHADLLLCSNMSSGAYG